MLDLLKRLLLFFPLCCQVWSVSVLIFRGKLNDKYRAKNVTASSSEKCWESCGAQHCAVSYRNGICFVYFVTSQLVLLGRAQGLGRVLAYNGEGWETVVARPEKMLQSPIIFWTFDDAVKGSNLGSAGPRLDMNRTNGLLYDKEGPRPASHLRYARRRGAMYELNRVSIMQNGRLLFTPTRPFTFATWFRVKEPTESFDLLTGNPMHSLILRFGYASQYCQRGMAEPCYSQRELERFKLATSKLNVMYSDLIFSTYWYPAPQTGWMHFVYVWHGGKKFRFYINGKPWPGYEQTQQVVLKTPTALSLWSGSRTTYKSLSQACVAVFQAALEEEAVVNLFQSCP